ncbi:MAG: AbrB/MazE/SpoVT family DNA-binding domain-containing protein [Cyanobacteriota bacterium]
MLTKVIKIGNSKGIRIPSNILKQCSIEEDIELDVKNNQIILKSIKKSRDGWDSAMKKMSKLKEDTLFIDDNIDNEMDDWEWE